MCNQTKHRNNEKRSRCQIWFLFYILCFLSFIFLVIFFSFTAVRKRRKYGFSAIATVVRCATWNFKVSGLYLFVVASLQLNRSTVFKLLGPCFRWLTQSFKLLADSLLLFETNEPISERKIHSICSLLRSTCFPFLDHHMCDDGLIVK